MVTATVSHPVTAFVMKEGDKFVCVIDKERIGASKHEDYFEYHLRRGDVKVLKDSSIQKFAYVDDTGTVTKIVDVAAPVDPTVPKISAEIKKAATAARAVAAAH